MTSIKNTNQPVQTQQPVVVNNLPQNIRRVNFKAEKDSFTRQQNGPVYTQPPMLDQQAAMRKALEDQKKVQKNAKRKQNLITALTLAGTAVMLIYFGRALIKDIRLDKLAREASENGDPSGALREIGVKTKEDLLGLFKDVSDRPSFEDIHIDKKFKEILDEFMDKIENAKTYEDAKQELERVTIFWGPPGTGKTTFVNAICKKFGIKPFEYDMGILKAGYQGSTENNMVNSSKVFLEQHRAARAKNPNHISVMFFDECDEVFLEALGNNRGSDNQIMTRFKRYLDVWKEEPGVLIFANTNKHPSELNSAISNRARRIYVPNPTSEGLSKNFFKHFEGGVVAENLKSPTKKSEELFKILEAKNSGDFSKIEIPSEYYSIVNSDNYRDFSYRELERVGWKTGTVPKGRLLNLDDIIQRIIDNGALKLNSEELDQLRHLQTLTDDLLPKVVA